jgi:prepilin-type N-terminal cleavage/methylation domain-containing protein
MSARGLHARTRRTSGADEGFTLIELLVIMLILAILAAIVVFTLSGVAPKSIRTACASDARTVDTATSSYLIENPSVAQVTEAQLTAQGTGTLQTWPASQNNAYVILIAGSGAGTVLVGVADANGNVIHRNDVVVEVGSNYYDVSGTGLPAACSEA